MTIRMHDGKLLKDSNGNLMIGECCCDSSSSESFIITCNSCSPRLHVAYNVSFSGLTGYFLAYNGTYLLVNTLGFCQWRWDGTGGDYINLDWTNYLGVDRWFVQASFAGETLSYATDSPITPCSTSGSYDYTVTAFPPIHEADAVDSHASI